MDALSGEALPERLRVIPDPPRRLYARGAVEALAAPSVAIVGSRRATRAGRQFAEALAGDLAAAGLVVVSGLAYGIDAAAHRGALVGGGRTVAVLGSGLGHVYPRQHAALAAEIVDGGGALVSEYPDDRAPRKHQFPERNRLISGLSLGVVIVEATTKSGSLITARMAAEQGREVMAVPGPVTSPLSGGCHRLLKSGAALIESADDVLYAVGYDTVERPREDGDAAPARLAAVLERVGAPGPRRWTRSWRPRAWGPRRPRRPWWSSSCSGLSRPTAAGIFGRLPDPEGTPKEAAADGLGSRVDGLGV